MALSAQRHEEIDASLQRIHEYLAALAAEIDAAAPPTNKQGHTYQIAVYAANQLVLLRHALQKEQENQGIRKPNCRPKKTPGDGQ